MLRCRLVLILAAAGDAAAQAETVRPGWHLALDWLQGQVEEYRARLDETRTILERRAAGDAKLLLRLAPPVPRVQPQGYGLLPELLPDLDLADVPLNRTAFSIDDLTRRSASLWRDGYQLVKLAPTGTDLAGLVGEFERLKGHLSWAQGQISYHRYWQQAVVEYDRFFAGRNRLLGDAQWLKELVDQKGDPARIERLRTLIEAKVAPFRKTAGLRLQVAADGTRTLPVPVVTDIDDRGFLDAFAAAVDQAYNRAAAARDKRFRIALTFSHLAAAKLYGGEPPARGAPVDGKAHVARFPSDALVLTTGAESTHAFVGRSIQLGTRPMRARELAHEFGHLLGFSDAYLRGFEGEPGSRLGCTLIEWGGLQDNLMGSATSGRVTAGMVQRLLDAYGD